MYRTSSNRTSGCSQHQCSSKATNPQSCELALLSFTAPGQISIPSTIQGSWGRPFGLKPSLKPCSSRASGSDPSRALFCCSPMMSRIMADRSASDFDEKNASERNSVSGIVIECGILTILAEGSDSSKPCWLKIGYKVSHSL